MGEKLGPAKGRIQVQANRYEGLVVLVNQLIESAGTSILAGPEGGQARRGADREGARGPRPAVEVDGRGAEHHDVDRGHRAAGLRGAADSTLHDQLPVRLSVGEVQRPDVFKQMGAAKYPEVEAGKPSKPPIGGINIGVSSYSKHKDAGLRGDRVPRQAREPARGRRRSAGCRRCARTSTTSPRSTRSIPASPTRSARRSRTPAPRPSESPAYQDLSLAIQRAVHPTTKIDPQNPAGGLRQAARQRREGRQARGPAVTAVPAVGSRQRKAAQARRADADDRPHEGRAQARADAVRAGGHRDAAGDGLSDPLRGRPVGAEGRPALPRGERLRRPGQLRGGAELAAVVAGPLQHGARDRRLGRDRARARHGARARHAPARCSAAA